MRRRVRHAVVRLWAGGVAQERPRAAAAQEHAVRVPYGSCGAASSPPRAGQPTVCVRHTARRRLWGVQLVRQGRERGVGEKGARTRCAGGPFRLRILVCVSAIAGLEEGARLGAKEMRRRSATASFAGGALPADENEATGFPEPSPTGGRARSRRHASRTGPESLVRARLPHAARARSKKEKKAAARKSSKRKRVGTLERAKTSKQKHTHIRSNTSSGAVGEGVIRRDPTRWVGFHGSRIVSPTLSVYGRF